MTVRLDEPFAHLGGRLATGLVDVTDDLAALDGSGWWAVVVTYEGAVTAARFASVSPAPLPSPTSPWPGVPRSAWCSSLDEDQYVAAADRIREAIARGDVYQANLCRVLRAGAPPGADVLGLAAELFEGNPAPYQGVVRLPDHDVAVATASPELFLRRRGDVVESSPIKGTGRTPGDLQPKDRAENVMIVDLVRNDLSEVARVGSVSVPSLLAVEPHPGLVHLVSTVRAELRDDAGWPQLMAAAFPPGSVTGAPKSSALRILDALEPVPREVYCGAVGWVDADRREAQLAVAIRTFWLSSGAGDADGPQLRFGTGAGITWGSEPRREWDETELKAARLLRVAGSGRTAAAPARPVERERS